MDIDALSDDDETFGTIYGDDGIVEVLGPMPPPRRLRKGKSADSSKLEEYPENVDFDDGGLFGEPSNDVEDDAPPPTLWWDDIGRG